MCVTSVMISMLFVERSGWTADADRLELFGGRHSCHPCGERPSMGVSISEEALDFTSPAYSDRACWVCELIQEAQLSHSLPAGCLVRLVDKDPDRRGSSQVRGTMQKQ